jgi:hypothetical protein
LDFLTGSDIQLIILRLGLLGSSVLRWIRLTPKVIPSAAALLHEITGLKLKKYLADL